MTEHPAPSPTNSPTGHAARSNYPAATLNPPAQSAPRQAVLAVRDEVAKVVVGQDGILTGVIAALLVNGHVLLEGVPGVAKTLLAKSLAAAFDMSFSRVQFTPCLLYTSPSPRAS